MVAKDIRWIRLLDPENHNISWANHISHTNPGKRDKSDPSFKRQWSRLFHCAALVMALALFWAVSVGMWDVVNKATPAEKNRRTRDPATCCAA